MRALLSNCEQADGAVGRGPGSDTNVMVSANLVDERSLRRHPGFGGQQKNPAVCFPGNLGGIQRGTPQAPPQARSGANRRFPGVIRKTSMEVLPNNILKISAHESDNRFYECAEAAHRVGA
jgi:hypothetical protein